MMAVVLSAVSWASEPITGLLERIDKGLSEKLSVEIKPGEDDYFEMRQCGDSPLITANNNVSAAMGVHWYLKYVAGVHLSWNSMSAKLPAKLPAVPEPVRISTGMSLRYYLNYCTYSYSMAFWNWERWEREIDFMALHGINMPLVITGSDAVWRNVLRRLGYSDREIAGFVAGPGFQAWWLMNNLEGWGGPLSQAWYERSVDLTRRILERMRDFGMMPVLPGYSGMLPHDAAETLGVSVADPGKWLGFTRPAFLLPTDSGFHRIADIYYSEQQRLFGQVPFYSMDPFHEGGNTDGVDLSAAGRAIFDAMRRNNPHAAWVIQAWQGNPRSEMINSLPAGGVVALDLNAENIPQWRVRPDGFGHHDWLYCMLLNFGGNVGLYGKMPAVINGYDVAVAGSRTLKGIGLTMEGIENNPVMYELMCELPWRGSVELRKWLLDYAKARYGGLSPAVVEAWKLLMESVYACPVDNHQQGTTESVFCARPSDNPRDVSSWAASESYYVHDDVYRAAQLLAESADEFSGNENYIYDLVDVTRQAVADRGRDVAADFAAAAVSGDSCAYAVASRKFLRLIDLQDRLLGTLPDFRVGRWIEQARACGTTEEERDLYEWNARVQITTWGPRAASDDGGLHDYAHREWQGLLHDFYRPRWEYWFRERLAKWGGGTIPDIDFYAMEEAWTRETGGYSSVPSGNPVVTVREVLAELAD